MNFARYLTLLLLAPASLSALSQEPPPATAPAPIVQPAPPAAVRPSSGTAAPLPAPHLTVSHPVQHVDKAAKPAATTPSKPPRTSESSLKAVTRLISEPLTRNLVFLDPGHGAGDTGSRINDQLTEKDITLSLAFHLRSLLAARGFTVSMTRDSDAPSTPSATPLSLDDRAGIANHGHPVACLLLHATASGRGVHVYTSELEPVSPEPLPTPWLTAQAAWTGESQKLASQIGAALGRAKIPLVLSRASVRPVDSLTSPALVLELAPETSDAASINDAHYQQRVAEAIAGALVFWQTQAQPPQRPAPPASQPSAASTEAHP